MTTNSTNVRSTRTAPAAVRAWFRAISTLAPKFAEQQAAKFFITPRVRKTATPTELHATLLPERAMERRAGEADPAYPELSTGRIALWSWGRGPTVLLVHGWAGTASDMAPIAAALVRAGYRTVLFDMPGHGDSEKGGRTNLYVYIQTLEALGHLIGPIHTVVGHSLGGCAAAIALGERMLTAQRAVLLAPALSPWAFSWHFAEAIGLPKARVPGMVARTEEIVGKKADSLDAARSVRGLDTPAYITHDPEDLDVPFDHGQALAAAWPGAEFVARPGVGHRRILKDPETVAEVVEFVTGAEAQRRGGAGPVRSGVMVEA
jgi:pimeloyl-ACP methyl ester carboxylesterase